MQRAQKYKTHKRPLAMAMTRRGLLRSTAVASTALAMGWESVLGEATLVCDQALSGGKLIRTLRFEDEKRTRYHQRSQQGWDGRLYADLSLITADKPLMSNQQFFIRTMAPDGLKQRQPWQLHIGGLLDPLAQSKKLSMAQLLPLAKPQGALVLECSGNWGEGFALMSAASWRGILIEDLIQLVSPNANATQLLVSGFDRHASASRYSTPGASWVFSLAQLRQAGAFLATHMNGELLSPDYGAPLRLLVPGWYGCTAIKWVNELRLVDKAEPATAQMKEFAQRTHQHGVPNLARHFSPALADQAAMPVRVEQWQVGGNTSYRVIGILWGGQRPVKHLTLRFNPGEKYLPVTICPAMQHNQPWTVWSHVWHPPVPGNYAMRARIDDDGIGTNRLDMGWYDRKVNISDA